jgi:hypothetical protein
MAPEGERIDQGLPQDHVALATSLRPASCTPARSNTPTCRPGKIEVLGCTRAQIVTQLADLDHDADFIEHGDDQAAIEVLVPALTNQANALQAFARLRPGS